MSNLVYPVFEKEANPNWSVGHKIQPVQIQTETAQEHSARLATELLTLLREYCSVSTIHEIRKFAHLKPILLSPTARAYRLSLDIKFVFDSEQQHQQLLGSLVKNELLKDKEIEID